jgi:hypothetical protein
VLFLNYSLQFLLSHLWQKSLNFVPEGETEILLFLLWSKQCQIFVVRSVSSIIYNLGWPYLVHLLIMVSACQPAMCHLILTSFSWSTNFAIQSRFSIFGPHIDYGRSISARFVSFSLDLIFMVSIVLQPKFTKIWSTHWSWWVHVSQACVVWPWPHFDSLLT